MNNPNQQNDRRPVIAPPQSPKPEWKPRTAKEMRDADWFHMTPKFARPTAADMQERADRQRDIDQCIEEHCSFDQLRNPRSILGKEHGRLRKEKLVAEAKVAAEVTKREKRRLAQKAARQRKAAAKKAAAELPPEA